MKKARGRRRGRTAAGRTAAEHQPAWFGIAADNPASEGDWFVGVVFNRPLNQVLTYRVPNRLGRIIQAGQRVRVPLGRGDRLAVGYCVSVDSRPPSDLEPARIKEVVEVLDPLPLIDPKMLELALDRGLLRLHLGTGAACRRAGRGQEAGGDANRQVSHRARGNARGAASPIDQARADLQAGHSAGCPLPERQGFNDGGCLPAGQMHDGSRPGAPEAGTGSYGEAAAPR